MGEPVTPLITVSVPALSLMKMSDLVLSSIKFSDPVQLPVGGVIYFCDQ